MEVKLEKIGPMLYAYAVEDGQFMAQGSTVEALMDAMKARYKEIKFVVREQHGANFLKENG